MATTATALDEALGRIRFEFEQACLQEGIDGDLTGDAWGNVEMLLYPCLSDPLKVEIPRYTYVVVERYSNHGTDTLLKETGQVFRFDRSLAIGRAHNYSVRIGAVDA